MINLTQICIACKWHLATTQAMLVDHGLSRRDAQAFAAFAFADHAEVGDNPDDLLTDDQNDRLAFVRDEWLVCRSAATAQDAQDIESHLIASRRR